MNSKIEENDPANYLNMLAELFLYYVRSEDYITLSSQSRNKLVDDYIELKSLINWMMQFNVALKEEKQMHLN